jgi:hypothetical protein
MEVNGSKTACRLASGVSGSPDAHQSGQWLNPYADFANSCPT